MKYRYDYVYGKVCDDETGEYVCAFTQAGITRKMSKARADKRMSAYFENEQVAGEAAF